MRKVTIVITALLLGAGITGCKGNSEEQVPEQPRSTNVDSTNIYGTAPAQYGHDNPADTTPRFPEEDDTGRRANTDQR
ncbi:hypothetical protein [Taibaiella chishuiensis]|uniref:Lipoprotein n=1 Tax=Taibaiella chishuiensis TaxID=1434707 RepID=A0A2P8D3D0_9BACT|nr:hypothetical protein [Taibaiella chishuiensis]PSK91679.1 hypothetical protein B0I18_105264 [Taibaiella chishuiensis]